MSKSFRIALQEDWLRKGDKFSDTKTTMIITSTPRMHYWQRLKKFFGFSYEWYYKAKEV